MKKLLILFLSFFCIFNIYSQSFIRFEKNETFFPDWRELKDEKIDYYKLSVPENYDNPSGRKIKLAVTVIHSKSIKNNPVVFVQGGPGGSTISGLWRWLGHPLRDTGDIILIDIRGTGFSEPTMCPDLGKKFFEVLSKNQTPIEDEQEKVKLSIECQQDLINSGVDLNAYNSFSVAKDLNTLKSVLKIDKWNVYGVSYGTFLSQTYANLFPNDIKSLILDSPISDISNYYAENSFNYQTSLNLLFKKCEEDSLCNKEYPNLQQKYNEVVNELIENPITVEVDKSVSKSQKFTYNSEDFKIAIQQSLYQNKLIELIPLMIYQFKDRNVNSLSVLVKAFSGALSLDYGTYFCFTCSEAIPKSNSFHLKNNNNLKLSFYKSDVDVCRLWNKNVITNSSRFAEPWLKNNNYPVIVFSGEFDPITPKVFAELTVKKYNNSRLVFANSYGHGPSFSRNGNEILKSFVNENRQNSGKIIFGNNKTNFITNIHLNKGVYNVATSINSFDWLFFTPLFISTLILLSFMCFGIIKFKNINFDLTIIITWITILICLVSLIFLGYSVFKTSLLNSYILAFGLMSAYSFLFFLINLGFLMSIITVSIFIINYKKQKDILQYFSLVLFSLLVLNMYMIYWGFLFNFQI